jgi:hypothetical protein
MNYEIVPRENYLLVTTSGPVDTDDYAECLDAIFNHPDWRPGYAYIFDHTLLDASKLKREDVDRISEIARTRRGKYGVGKSAVVAPNDVEYGIIRMVMVYAEDGDRIPTNVFRTLDEAVDWLFSA